jgi:D-amino-acid dehydrogenase
LASLQQFLIKNGVELEENCAMTGFDASRTRINGIVTTKGRYSAGHYVLATGAWLPRLSRQLGVRIAIQPAKGYSITMQRPDTCPRIPCYFHDTRVVATPWHDGLRLGGTLEFSGFNTSANSARIASLKKAASAYLRTSAPQGMIEEWAGLRPMTYDDLPVIGRVPGRAELILAGGHGMMGMSMAAGTGRIVADLVAGRDTGIDISPFSPARF